MSIPRIDRTDHFGLVRPGVDAHTLGLISVAQLLGDCGYRCFTADAAACGALDRLDDPTCADVFEGWLREHGITVLGFSYRLDPEEGAARLGRLMHELHKRRLLQPEGGPLKAVFFAGLPQTCELVRQRIPEVAGTFCGDETPAETMRLLGVDTGTIPKTLVEGITYDEARLAFGRDLVQKGTYLGVRAADRSGYPGFGTMADTVTARLHHAAARQGLPLMRAHAGPYLADRQEAVRVFLDWSRRLAASGHLDVLSIGTSQLSQSHFGEEWGERPNGGGVPLNSAEEFAAVWQAARPMLVRTYAGTRDIPTLARMYEETVHIAWHALSLWWFCQIDGRGPYSVRANLQQHFETMRYIAATGKPLELNVPHHFAFRGADDVTYIVSAVLAARAAKAQGIRFLIQQIMLNTPKYTWGVQDLAKSRALLQLVRELEDDRFRVILQPRGGLNYFSSDSAKAKAQLAAVSALMDDIEPANQASPPLIHVVSYSEGSGLADPGVIDESIKITRHALAEYRRLRAKGDIDDMTRHPDVQRRTDELLSEARTVLRAIEATIREPYTAEGLYQVFAMGFLPVPYLWECREEFINAVHWQTRLVRGAVTVVDEKSIPVQAKARMGQLLALRTGSGQVLDSGTPGKRESQP